MGIVYEGGGANCKCPNCKCPLVIESQTHQFGADSYGYLDEEATREAIREWKVKKRRDVKWIKEHTTG